MATHDVFIVRYVGMPTFHDAIYIETDEDGGNLYHVIGSHKDGFSYEKKRTSRPENSKSFNNKYPKGTVARDKLDSVDRICRGVPMPRNRVEQGINIRRDCRHWVSDALEKLEDEKILKKK